MIEIASHRSVHGTVSILKSPNRESYLYKDGDVFQSEADGCGTSLTPYIHAIHGLVRQTAANHVLVIGCAGGTLATMLAMSGGEVTVVDVNPVAFEFARRFFAMPDQVTCHVADGLSFLRSASERFDAVVLDAYERDAIPPHLASVYFLSLVHRAVGPTGSFFANVHLLDDADPAAEQLARRALQFWPNARLLDAAGMPNRNAIVATGAVEALVPPALDLAPAFEREQISRDLDAMRFRTMKPNHPMPEN